MDEGACPFEGSSSLEGLVAPVTQHHHTVLRTIDIPVFDTAHVPAAR
jgi:hypothetical protein